MGPSRKKDPSASAAQGLGGSVMTNAFEQPGRPPIPTRLTKRPPSRHKEPPKALHLELDPDVSNVAEDEKNCGDKNAPTTSMGLQRADSSSFFKKSANNPHNTSQNLNSHN